MAVVLSTLIVALLLLLTLRARAVRVLLGRLRSPTSEPPYRGIVENSLDGIWAIDAKGETTFVNRRMARMLGYQSWEMEGRHFSQFLSLASRGQSASTLERWTRGIEERHAFDLKHRDGHLVPTMVSTTALREARGGYAGASATVSDLSDWQRVEDALRQTETKYRALIEITRTGFAIVDGAGRVVDANSEYVRLTGRPSLADILGRPVTLWTAPWDLERNRGEIRHAIESGSTTALEVDYRHPDGTIVPIEVNAALIAPDRIMALCRDITSRRQAQLALEASEAEARVRSEELASVLNTVPAVVWIARDPESKEITGNHAAHAVLRMPNGKNLSKSAPNGNHPTHFKVYQDGRELATDELPVQVAAAEGVELHGFEMSLGFDDGTTTHLLGNVTPLRDPQGATRGAVAAFVDITSRKTVEAALQQAERHNRAMVDSSPLSIISLTADGLVSGWNPASERTFGFGATEVMHQYLPIVDDETDSEHRKWRAEVLAGHAFHGRTTRRRHKDGHKIDVSVSTAPTRGGDGTIVGLVAIYEDITERRQLERIRQQLHDRMQEAQRLESLGVLAGGIAHDFNNLLTMILGNIHMAREDLPAGSLTLESLHHAEVATRRAADLTAQMLSYAGKGPFTLEPVDLGGVIRDTSGLLEAAIPDRAKLHLDLHPGLPSIEGEPTQLRQMLLNLASNAGEALNSGSGGITIRTGPTTVDSQYLAGTLPPGLMSPGECVFVEVLDNGEGMSGEVVKRIFEPFYTTRFPGRGLGLAAVLGIVRRHRGAIRVESVQGEGTVMRVLFPIHR